MISESVSRVEYGDTDEETEVLSVLLGTRKRGAGPESNAFGVVLIVRTAGGAKFGPASS